MDVLTTLPDTSICTVIVRASSPCFYALTYRNAPGSTLNDLGQGILAVYCSAPPWALDIVIITQLPLCPVTEYLTVLA